MSTPIRVLLLEDRAADAELILRTLRRGGFDPVGHRVDTESDFLAHLDATLDVILADFSLPQFDAFRALALVGARGLDVPVIVISGSIGEDVAVATIRAGAVDYLLKDRLERLSEVVRRVIAQRQLRREKELSDARLRLAFEAANIGAWDLLVPSDTVVWSPTLSALIGLPAETRTMTTADFRATFVHAEDRARTAAMKANATGSEQFQDLEYRVVRPDGDVRWLVDVGRVVERGPDGTWLRAAGVTIDITARRLAEREVRFQALLLDQATVAVIATDPTGIITHWSRHAEILYGWSRDEVVGRSIGELAVCPTDPAVIARLLGGESWEGDYVSHRKDGSPVPVHGVDSPVRDERGETVAFVGVSVDISERKAFETQLAHQATHDPLTGLPNRTLFTERLGRELAAAKARCQVATVLFLDLDGFKRVNDSFGHAVGDQLLVAVGQRLADGLDPHATLARFGGDEFTILLPDVSTTHAAEVAAVRLLDHLRAPFALNGREIYADASIGVAQSSPELSRPDDLVRAADVALYQAKTAGRATYRIFNPEVASNMSARLELESELRRAVERGELRVYFQPEVDLSTGAIVGAEALMRWQHPRLGLLAPGEFVPIAEESELIVPIGGWVLAEACRQTLGWRPLESAANRLVVSVNLTARQLRHPMLIGTIRQSLSEAGLAPHQLKLEITERTIVEDTEGETDALARLRRLGVKLAIDDFGTGYSSLGYLRRWPVDTLKIDRSFVTGVEDDSGGQQLVAAMAGLAHALGADVTAEGIETAGQLAWLRGIGVDRGQGYFFSPPLPADEFANLLARNRFYDLGSCPVTWSQTMCDPVDTVWRRLSETAPPVETVRGVTQIGGVGQ